MKALPVIAIFDIGKTNKKIFLFDEQYSIVFERTVKLNETIDEDGFPCEDIALLTDWVLTTFDEIRLMPQFNIRALNFSAYGASFVHIDESGTPVLPLYNYLKPYPEQLLKKFYNTYGGEEKLVLDTASPVLGNLNSGMQLYFLKHERPDFYQQIKWSLHLPQYISYVISKKVCSEITSIGCHTNLWDFKKQAYHDWVSHEGINNLLPPICTANDKHASADPTGEIAVGTGFHDSSAALIPYLTNFQEPFILISTGTWCITLNPFNGIPLTVDESKEDCLCYLTHNGTAVKASRIFAGNEHEQQVKRLADHFKTAVDYYTTVEYDAAVFNKLKKKKSDSRVKQALQNWSSVFSNRSLLSFSTYEEAYHQLMYDIIVQQAVSSQFVIKGTAVKRIFVDGGFSKNNVYMFLLAQAFPEMEVYAASVSQASSIGAALVMHKYWNTKSLPGNIIDLNFFSSSAVAT